MCKAFSALVLDSGEVRWKFGVDSHSQLETLFGLRDDSGKLSELRHAKIEIAPANGNYLHPDKWEFRIDEDRTPDWWGAECELAARKAHRAWLRKLRKVLVVKPIVNPLSVKAPKVGSKHLKLLRKWASVWASVRDFVWASVWAYAGSFFSLPRSAWRHTEKIGGKKYPFQSAVGLWESGLVPSFNGKIWRLHGGPKAEILWQGTIRNLEEK